MTVLAPPRGSPHVVFDERGAPPHRLEELTNWLVAAPARSRTAKHPPDEVHGEIVPPEEA